MKEEYKAKNTQENSEKNEKSVRTTAGGVNGKGQSAINVNWTFDDCWNRLTLQYT